jgi:hypothetical protein
MAILYTYPVKTNPVGDDLILISDSADSRKTKQVKVSSLPSSGGGSVSSVGLSLSNLAAFSVTGDNPVTGSGTITLGTTGGSTGQYLDYQGNWSTPSGSGGDTYTLQADTKSGLLVPLKLDAATGTDSTVNLKEGANITLTRNSATEIEIIANLGGNANGQIQYKNGTAFGASANLTFTTNTLAVTHTIDVKGDGTNAGKLKLYCPNTTTPHAVTLEGPAHNGASDYTLKMPSPAPSNQQILQSDGSGNLSWINTPSSGGGGSVDSVNTTDGTFINLTPNSATTGAVTVTADLSAVDGTSDTTTRFLSKNNTWDVPSYTTDTTYSAGTGLALNTNTFSLASGAALTNLGGGSGNTYLKKDGTWANPADGNTTYSYSVPSSTTTLRLAESTGTDYDVALVGGTNVTITRDNTNQLTFTSTDTNTNIYTTNGTLGAAREVTMGSNTLTFKNATNQVFQWDPTTYTYKVGNSVNGYKGTIRIDGNGGGGRGGILELESGDNANYHVQVKGPDTMSASYAVTLPSAQGANNTYLKNDGSGGLTWATGTGGGTTYTLQAEAKSGTSVPLKLDAATGTDSTVNLTEGSNITLTRNSASQITIASSGGGGSLGFAPLEIYSANTTSSSNHSIYYMVTVCDVDFTVNKCKVAVTSGTDPVYVAVYSMSGSTLQNSTLVKLGALNNSASIVGVNELSLTDSAFSLTAGQTICIGISTANILASGAGINNTNFGLMNNTGGSALPANPDFEGFGSANSRPAIHFYAS